MKTYWIVDGSYALASVEGKMEPASGNELFGRKFSVLASGCVLPADSPSGLDPKINNTVAVDIRSGQVVFTQWRFLRKIEHCSQCGHSINGSE